MGQYTGERLGVELAELQVCGRTYLPTVGYAVSLAFAKVLESDVSDELSDLLRVEVSSDLFRRSGDLVRVGLSDMHVVWQSLQRALLQMLAESLANIKESGDALVRVADSYAATDAAAAERMKAELKKYGLDTK
jgi:hypothetical protein